MANPFAQADSNFVLPNRKPEQQNQEALKNGAERPEEAFSSPEAKDIPAVREKSQKAANSSESRKHPSVEENLLKNLVRNKPSFHTYSFYLEDEVNRGLEILARENGVNKSQLLNELLKNLLYPQE